MPITLSTIKDAARVYHTATGNCISHMVGHEGEISKVQFNPQGTKVVTASGDKTCKLWRVDTGECVQTLEGHMDEIFSCAFNYDGTTLLSGSKDNSVRVWKC